MRSWEHLESLFHDFLRGDHSAWEAIRDLALPRLAAGVKPCAGRTLSTWEIEEVCEDALLVTTLRFKKFKRWSQAWVYMKKVAKSKLLHRRRKVKGSLSLSLSLFAAELDARHSSDSSHRLQMLTELDEFLDGLDEVDRQLFDALVAHASSLTTLATELGISNYALRQRKRNLLRRLRRHFDK